MKFRYTGDHEVVTTRGYTFPRGEYVEVADEKSKRKLAGNREFERMKPGRKNADEG